VIDVKDDSKNGSERLQDRGEYLDEAEELLLEEKERLSMLRKRREERLRGETQGIEPGNGEEDNPDRWGPQEDVEVLKTVPTVNAVEKAEMAGNEEYEENAENEETELPVKPVISPSEPPKKASKSKPPGTPLMKILVFGAVFCLLLFGSWVLIGGTEDGVGGAEDAGDAEDAGNARATGNDDTALPESLLEPSPISSDSSPEKAQNSLDSPLNPPLNPPESFTNSLGIDFILVPAGEFFMGSPETEAGRQADESPLHTVLLEKPFYLGKYEVTREQWYEVMGTAGEMEDPLPGDPELPVAEVSWDDVQEFVKKLNAMEGTDKYRLPSEAEWEYACRAGSSTKYSFGDAESEMVKYAWFGKSQGSAPHPVGQKAPNAWGLYDMHGNVWEWVRDSWHNDYNAAPSDGKAWESGEFSHRIARGGSLTGSAESCRAANRAWFGSDVRNADMGFRLLMEV